MKKGICILLAVGMIAAFAACDNGSGKSTGGNTNIHSGNVGGTNGGSTNGGSSGGGLVKGAQVTQEEWNTAWVNFIEANNVNAEIKVTSIEYPDEDPYRFDETHTLKVADDKYYSYGRGVETDGVEESPWMEEKYIGKVDGVAYAWERSGDTEAEMKAAEWRTYAYSGEYSTLGAAMEHSFYSLSVLTEENAYVNYYSLAEYDESKGAYVIEYDTTAEEREVGTLEIKIINGQITKIKYTMERIRNNEVRERNAFDYTFTYGSATVGDLPALTE